MFEVTIPVPDGKYSTEMVTFITVVPFTTASTTTTTVSISFQLTDEFFSLSNNRHSLFLQMHVPVCVCILRQERVEWVLGFTAHVCGGFPSQELCMLLLTLSGHMAGCVAIQDYIYIYKKSVIKSRGCGGLCMCAYYIHKHYLKKKPHYVPYKHLL